MYTICALLLIMINRIFQWKLIYFEGLVYNKSYLRTERPKLNFAVLCVLNSSVAFKSQ